MIVVLVGRRAEVHFSVELKEYMIKIAVNIGRFTDNFRDLSKGCQKRHQNEEEYEAGYIYEEKQSLNFTGDLYQAFESYMRKTGKRV